MSAKDIIVNRDRDNDVLYIIKQGVDNSNTINLVADEDIIIRMDRKMHELVGFTIENFSDNYPDLEDQHDYLIMERFDQIMTIANTSYKAMCTA